MLDHYLIILGRIREQLKMVDIVLDFRKVHVVDQHANISME